MARDGAETAGGLFSEGPDLLEDVRRGGRARHAAEDDTAEQRRTTKTVRAMDAARDLARGEEAGDRLSALVEHARLGIDLEPTHGVVKDRRHEGDVEVVVELPLGVGEELRSNGNNSE